MIDRTELIGIGIMHGPRRRLLARAAFVVPWAFVVASAPLAHAAGAMSMSDAISIRDECVSAETGLVAARSRAATVDATFQNSLLVGQVHALNAYRASLFAPWTAQLSTIRSAVEDSLTLTMNRLAPLSLPSATSLNIGGILDAEIARIHNVVALLQGTASAAPSAATTTTASSSTIADLVPGTGFGGATAQPSAAGSGRGADAKAIARWDVVPYQTFTGKLPVGVVAFHMAGIDRVEFSVNGGPWTAVRAMTLNPVTGVWEYNSNVDAATLADGQCEVRAVVYPTVGTPRVLAGPHDASDLALASGEHSLFLSVNQGGALAGLTRWVSPTGSDTTGNGSSALPFATITKAAAHIQSTGGASDGATIYLAAGDYALPNMSAPDSSVVPTTTTRWLTVCAATGVTNDRVRINSLQSPNTTRGLNTALVHLKNLTVRDVNVVSGTWASNWRLWVDGCTLDSGSPTTSNWMLRPDEWRGGVYVTDSKFTNVRNASWGVTLIRNSVITDIGGDGLRDPIGLVVNVEEKNVVNYDDDHCDVLQWASPPVATKFENVIVYGLKAVQNVQAQALFVQQYGSGVNFENFAFVNYLTYAWWGGQWQNPGKHVLMWNMEMVSHPDHLSQNKGGLMFVDVNSRVTSVHDLDVRNSIFQRFNLGHTGSEPSASDTSWADSNHFIDATSYTALSPGTHATSGGDCTTLFADATAGDFTPIASVLLSRIAPLTPADASGHVRKASDAVGAAAQQ